MDPPKVKDIGCRVRAASMVVGIKAMDLLVPNFKQFQPTVPSNKFPITNLAALNQNLSSASFPITKLAVINQNLKTSLLITSAMKQYICTNAQ